MQAPTSAVNTLQENHRGLTLGSSRAQYQSAEVFGVTATEHGTPTNLTVPL